MREQVPGTKFTRSGITATPDYYADTVMMINMLIATGNMPNLIE
jgi:hypothetical protein